MSVAPAGVHSTGRGPFFIPPQMHQGKDPTIMTDQLIPSDLLHRAKVIDGLVELAAYLEAHPDVPVCAVRLGPERLHPRR